MVELGLFVRPQHSMLKVTKMNCYNCHGSCSWPHIFGFVGIAICLVFLLEKYDGNGIWLGKENAWEKRIRERVGRKWVYLPCKRKIVLTFDFLGKLFHIGKLKLSPSF